MIGLCDIISNLKSIGETVLNVSRSQGVFKGYILKSSMAPKINGVRPSGSMTSKIKFEVAW